MASRQKRMTAQTQRMASGKTDKQVRMAAAQVRRELAKRRKEGKSR